MATFTETEFVKTQYATSANLDARIALHEHYSTASQPFHEWLFDHVHLPANARVLEIGCGSGALWQRIAPRVPSSWHLTLTDYSFGMATQARANLQSLIPNLQSPISNYPTTQQPIPSLLPSFPPSIAFAQTDAQSLPFPDNTFDGIFANHMLYHVPDVDRALAEFRRVLKRGGTLYTATNGETHLKEMRELISSVTHQPERIVERGFSLENGASFLSKPFSTVTLDAQPNNLRITDTEPLITYILSGAPYTIDQVPASALDTFRTQIQNEINTNGAYHITKAVGLFISQ